MILENPATVNLLKALVDIGPRGSDELEELLS